MSRAYRQPFRREPIGTAIFLKTRHRNGRLFSARTMSLRDRFPFSLVVRHAHRGSRLITPSTFFRTLRNQQLNQRLHPAVYVLGNKSDESVARKTYSGQTRIQQLQVDILTLYKKTISSKLCRGPHEINPLRPNF